MRKLIGLFLLLFIQTAFHAYAIPAFPSSFVYIQPDGKPITLHLRGDEFLHFTTTADGYTVLKDTNNFYTYAELDTTDNLIPSNVVVRNETDRYRSDLAYLKTIKPFLLSNKDRVSSFSKRVGAVKKITPGSLRALNSPKYLVLLVEYSDVKFMSSNAGAEFTNLLTQRGYSDNGATGSALDYFEDNSFDQFHPDFVVKGPITLNRPRSAYGTERASEMVIDACNAIDETVNFKEFDLNDDGLIDNVYVIFAGGGSHVGGNPEEAIWPHQGTYTKPIAVYDEVGLYKYGCNAELYGRESNKKMDGLGTFCHEFGHVIGLPDLYDTDYEGSGGIAPNPSDWDIMALGSYLNESRTPAGYSIFEREMLGWAIPEKLNASGSYILDPLQQSNKGFVVCSESIGEYFYFENRQRNGWDSYLPGSGMMVYHVDKTTNDVWRNNTINCNPSHPYYRILPADNNYILSSEYLSGDPFPGTMSIHSLSDDTYPNLLAWNGTPSGRTLSQITETEGRISFDLITNSFSQLQEGFETMTKEDWTLNTANGKLGEWTLDNAKVVSTSESIPGEGEKTVSIKSGKIEMQFDLETPISSLSFLHANRNKLNKELKVEYSTDRGSSWSTLDKTMSFSNTNLLSRFMDVNLTPPIRFRWVSVGIAEMYIDNITFKSQTSSNNSMLELNRDINYYVSDRNLFIFLHDKLELPVNIYTVSGQKIFTERVIEGWNRFPFHAKGIYIMTVGDQRIKISL